MKLRLTRLGTAALALGLSALGPSRTAGAVSVEGYEPASPMEGATWLLDQGLYVKIHDFPDDSSYADFAEFINRSYTSVRKNRWSVGAQIDAVADAPPADPEEGPINQLFGSPAPPHATEDAYLLPEKLFLRYRARRFKAEVGDSYINIGRGIALSMVKRPEIDQDTSLRGVKLSLSTDPTDWTLFGGWANAQNISVISINRSLIIPSHELVFGTAGLIRPTGWLELGLHGVGTTFERPPEDGERRAGDHLTLLGEPVQMGTFGASARFPSLGPVDWYTEADLFLYGRDPDGEFAVIDDEGADAELRRGYAIYSGAQVFGSTLTFLAEVKRYHNHLQQNALSGVTENGITAAPTLELEEVIQPDSQHAVTSNDMTGYRLQWTLYLPETSHNVLFSWANFIDDYDISSHDREVIIHPYVSAQLYFTRGHHLFVTGGWRGEFNVEDDTPTGREYGDDMMAHVFVDGALVVKASTLELTTNLRAFHEATEEPYDWVSSESSLSWSYKGVLTVAALFDVTNERAALSGPLAVPGNLYNDDDPENPMGVFGAAEVTIRPTPSMGIKLFAGANKQGLRCTGGVCRWLPGFSGFRTELSFTL